MIGSRNNPSGARIFIIGAGGLGECVADILLTLQERDPAVVSVGPVDASPEK